MADIAILRLPSIRKKSMFPASTLKEYDASDRLVSLGLCSACADGAAYRYVHAPQSKCAQLVQRALMGNRAALDIFRQQPDFCD